MFGLGPIYVFLLKNRFNRKGARQKERMNTYLTNIIIVAVVAILCWAIVAIVSVSTWYYILNSRFSRIWLFYVQHTFEDSYFEEDKDWEYVKAAVEGSSFISFLKFCNS